MLWNLSWVEESAINGVSHAARAIRDERYFRTALWILVTLGLWAATGYLLYGVVASYCSYPVMTKVEVEYQSNGVAFPSVQFCNHNLIGCDQLFKLRLQLEDLWEASGCQVGLQIQPYVERVLNEFDASFSAEDLQNFKQILPYLRGYLGSMSAMVKFWAHLYTEPQDVLDMMSLPKFSEMLDRLQRFLNQTADSKRHEWSRFISNYTVEHKFAVAQLEKARRLWFFQSNFTANLLDMKDGKTGAKTMMLAPGSLAGSFAKTYLEFYSSDNLSDDNDLQAVWLNAMQSSNWTGTVQGASRLFQLTMNFLEKNILRTLHENPSLIWSYGEPRVTKEALEIVAKNVAVALKNWAPSPSNVSIRQPAKILPNINFTKLELFDASDARAFDQLLHDEDVVMPKNSFLIKAIEQLPTISRALHGNLDRFLRSCIFHGKQCNRSEIIPVLSAKYGFCYTFNPPKYFGIPMQPKTTFQEGPTGGLTMLLAVHGREYIRFPSQVTATGARIGIYSFKSPPNMEEDGIDLHPGQLTNIILRERLHERLPAPHPSNCQTQWSESPYKYEDYRYDYRTCRRFCMAHRILDKCGCLDPVSNAHEMRFQNRSRNNFGTTFWCNYSDPNTADSRCADAIRMQVGVSDEDRAAMCKCRPACLVQDYEIRSSAASFPSRGLMETLAESVALHPRRLEEDWEASKESLVGVKIYFSSFDLLKTTEEPRHDAMSMASDVGGAIGLLLGLCGINIIELILMITDLLTGATKKGNVVKDNGTQHVGTQCLWVEPIITTKSQNPSGLFE